MTKRARHSKKLPSWRRIICFRSINSSSSTCWTSVSTPPGRGYGVSSKKLPIQPAAHFFEGKILAAEEKWEAAQAELQKTLQLDPNFSAAYDLLVQTYLATNKLPQAVSQLQALLSKDPNNTAALMTLALVYERMKDFPKARDAYEKLLAIKSNFVPALNNLAYLYAERLNNLDKAYELARKARELQGHDQRLAIPWAGSFTNAATISKLCQFSRRARKKPPTIR